MQFVSGKVYTSLITMVWHIKCKARVTFSHFTILLKTYAKHKQDWMRVLCFFYPSSCSYSRDVVWHSGNA